MEEWVSETTSVALAAVGPSPRFLTADRKMILAAALGTTFEFYEFFLYGSLAATISRQFFSAVDETTGFLFALLAFAAGFFARPFGAAFFGRLGDLVGRKYTFLMTMFLMGAATVSVGLLPGYARLGIAAPILLIALRLLQGLALGGEYGGAAVYIAEQAPAGRRGYNTSWIQIAASMGMLLSLIVVLCCRLLTKSAFDDWGWRLPFWFSSILLIVSLWIRLSMKESSVFLQAKSEGKLSQAPLKEVFCRKENLRKLLIAFGGMVSGMTIVWYTGHFYAMYFLTQTLRVDPMTANLLMGAGLLIGTPFYILSGHLSDRFGRKPVMMTGLLAATLLFIPLFKGLTHYANPQLAQAARTNPVVVAADPTTCGFQFDPLGQRKNSSDCDKAKALLAKMGVPYSNAALPAGSGSVIRIGSKSIAGFDVRAIQSVLQSAGYPARADPAQINFVMVVLLLAALIALSALAYAPVGAALVEMFPTRIRYTALSVPYHLGVGWVGGLLPAVCFSLVVATGNVYYGLRFPILVAAVCFVIGMCFLKETNGRDISTD
jgi:MFS family permease